MKYRQFGDLNWKASALGFGTMRLPLKDDNPDNIDEEKAINMIRYAIDQGVNYIDTAWPYHKEMGEIVVGKALKDGYRQKVKLATKLPSWLIEKEEDIDKYLNKQLEKLQTDHIDFYLLHTLNKKHWANLKSINTLSVLEKMRKQGKIDYIGFSFHDDLKLFKKIVNYYNWDFCQIQYNYIDIDFQAGVQGLKYAASEGLPVVIMEPLRGGTLANTPPSSIQKIFAEAPVKRSPVDWALQWLWNQPQVSVVLSGMSKLKEVKENIKSASKSGIDSLSEKELNIIDKAGKKYREISPIGCTGCGYCMPCPNNVHIPINFQMYNEAKIYNMYDKKQKEYNNRINEKQQAASCIECGKCEDKCPQNLEISKLMPKVAEYFAD